MFMNLLGTIAFVSDVHEPILVQPKDKSKMALFKIEKQWC